MTKFNTGNPVGSSDPRDLSDNAAVADNLVTGEAPAYNDRLGKSRKSWQGMEDEFAAFIASSGYEFLGNYAAGIEITGYNQVVRDTSGEFWRVSGSTDLPYTTTGAGLPEGAAFVSVGDAALRQELARTVASGQGANLVNGATIYVGSVAELEALSLAVGVNVRLTDQVRFGDGTVKSGTPPSDPQKGVFITLANGNYWERDREPNLTKPRWFGGSSAATETENTLAVQAAHNLLPSTGGAIYIDELIECSGSLSFTKNILLKGNNRRGSGLVYTGIGTFITNFFLVIMDMSVSGKSPDGTLFFNSGSVGFSSSASIQTSGAALTNWDTIVSWAGGFYYKFIDTYFERFSNGFTKLNANNISFHGCRAALFDRFIRYNGGTGPISFYGGSVENFTDEIIRGEGGSASVINFNGVYVENKVTPQGWLSNGLEADDGASAIGIIGGTVLTTIGCSIVTPGLRFITGKFERIESSNYLFNVSGMDQYYSGSGLTLDAGGRFSDKAESGAFTTSYLLVSKGPSVIKATDPFTGKDISILPENELTLENGWTQDASGQVCRYSVIDGVLYLDGNIDGGAATSEQFATLPADIAGRIDTTKWFPAIKTDTGASVSARVAINGACRIEGLMTNIAFSVAIPLVSY